MSDRPLTAEELDAIRSRDASARNPAATWAVEDRRRLLATLDAARATPVDGLREAIEAEWYNGNLDESVRDRLLGDWQPETTPPSEPDAPQRAYAQGHADGMVCGRESAGFGYSECEHVGRFAAAISPRES